MSKIEQGRWSQLLRRATGAAGQEVVAGHLSPEISPVWIIQEADQDLDFLKIVRRMAVGIELGAGAGFLTKFRLRNPVDSGVISIVTSMDMRLDALSTVTGARGTAVTDLSVGNVPTTVIDERWGATSATGGTLILSVDNTTVLGPEGDNLFRDRLAAETRYRMPSELKIVLTPGTNFDWGAVTVNRLIRTSLTWFERPFPDLER